MLVSFFQARGKMCAAYDPSGAIIVCGGGPRFWRPSNNCWQLVKVFHKFYWNIHETLSILLGTSPLDIRLKNSADLSFKGFTDTWSEIPQMYPVHGAATTFYRGKFWVLGGSTGLLLWPHYLWYNTFCDHQVMTAMTTPSLTRSRPTTPRRRHGVSRWLKWAQYAIRHSGSSTIQSQILADAKNSALNQWAVNINCCVISW